MYPLQKKKKDTRSFLGDTYMIVNTKEREVGKLYV